MAEERVSYLEPIEEEVNRRDAFHPNGPSSESSHENIPTPDSRREHSEAKNESEALYQKILATSAPAPVADDERVVTNDAKHISLETDTQSRVRQLVDLAMTKGVPHAVKVARHLNDFYVLDQVHDELANTFYEALLEKNLITRE